MQESIYPSSTKKSSSISWNLRHATTISFHTKILSYSITKTHCWTYALSSTEKGVYLIQDLLDAECNIVSYTKFTEKYLLSCNLLAYLQVISAIPRKAIERAEVTPIEKTDFLSKNVFPLSSEICVNLLKMKNKEFYKLLINKDKIELKANNKMGSRYRILF